MERVMHLTVVTAVLLSVGILNAVSAQLENEELESLCEELEYVSCGDGWTRFDDIFCVKHFQTPKSFDDAQEYCNTTGSDLVTFNNEYEMMKAACITFRDSPVPESFWVGVIRSTEGFTNTDGSEVKHAEWYPDESENADGEENCITMNDGGWTTLNDDDCAKKNHFMCMQMM